MSLWMTRTTHYLLERGVDGNHCTEVSLKALSNGVETNGDGIPVHDDGAITNGNGVHSNGVNDHNIGGGAQPNGNESHVNGSNCCTEGHSNGMQKPSPKLLIFSALDEKSLERNMTQYRSFYTSEAYLSTRKVSPLAYTLSSRRTDMLWRNFSFTGDTPDKLSMAKPVRMSAEAGATFVFTGQRAQYVNMGVELLQYPVYRDAVERVDGVYKKLGCTWSIFGESPSASEQGKD